MNADHDFQHRLSEFLTRHLPGQAGLATNTIISYRDTFTLLVTYCATEEGVPPELITLDLLTRDLVERFLTWIETTRRCSPSSRNQRLAAIRSFCRFLQTRDVERIGQYQDILNVPKKKTPATTPNHLTLEAVKLVLAQPDMRTAPGRRDLALLALMYDSGARVQEAADLTVGDFRSDPPATIKITGKGGKTRIVPLMPPTAGLVQRYVEDAELAGHTNRSRPLFPNRAGAKITRAGIAYILDKHVTAARTEDETLLPDKITPHSLRHSKALHLLQAGVNLVYIRDILGHADLKTTEIYARIDGEMKRQALEAAYTNTTPSDAMPPWQQDKGLLAWLNSLGR